MSGSVSLPKKTQCPQSVCSVHFSCHPNDDHSRTSARRSTRSVARLYNEACIPIRTPIWAVAIASARADRSSMAEASVASPANSNSSQAPLRLNPRVLVNNSRSSSSILVILCRASPQVCLNTGSSPSLCSSSTLDTFLRGSSSSRSLSSSNIRDFRRDSNSKAASTARQCRPSRNSISSSFSNSSRSIRKTCSRTNLPAFLLRRSNPPGPRSRLLHR